MTTPVVASTFNGQTSTNGTNHSVTLPATIERGDLLLMICATDGNPTMTPPTGWTTIHPASYNGTAVGLAVFGKSAIGTEDGTSVTWTTGASEQTSTVGYRITGWGGTLADISIAGAPGTGTSTTPDPTNLNPANYTTEDFLWIGCMASDSNRTVSSGIAGFTGQSRVGSSTNNATVYAAYLAETNSSKNPGTLTLSGSDEWVATTLAIIGSKILVTEDFEGEGTSPASGDDMSALNTVFDLFNGVGDRKFTSASKNAGLLSGQFETFGTNQALVKDTTHLPGPVNGGVAQTQLWFRGYFRTPDDQDIDNRILVIEESTGDGGDDIAVLRISGSTGALTFLDGTTVRTNGSHAVDGHAHQHRIEMWVDQNSDYYEVRVWWAGDKDNPSTSATNYESFSGSFTSNLAMQVWGIGNYAGVNAKTRWDDVAIGIGGWIGPAAFDAEEVEIDGSLAVAFSNSATLGVTAAPVTTDFEGTDGADITTGTAPFIAGSTSGAATVKYKGFTSPTDLPIHGATMARFTAAAGELAYRALAFNSDTAKMSVYYKASNTGAVGEKRIINVSRIGTGLFGRVRVANSATPVFELYNNSATQSGSTQLVADQWYRLDYEWAVGGNHVLKLFTGANLHGSTPDETITQAFNGAGLASNPDFVELGVSLSQSQPTVWDYDQLHIHPTTQRGAAAFNPSPATASLAIAFSNSATLDVPAAAAKTIDGSLAISFTNSATFSVTNEASASLAVAFSNSAAFAVTNQVSGSLAVSFSNSAAFSVTNTATASLAVAFANSASFAVVNAVDASLAVAFSNSATFDVVTAAPEIDASLAVAFSNSAALSVTNTATASLAIAFANSASFAVTNSVQGSLAVAFSNSASFTVVKAITASLPIAFDNSFNMARDVSIEAELEIDVILAAALQVPSVGGGRPASGQLWPRGNW